MSELVEKVEGVLTDHWNSADIVNGETQARAAIAAVAEWLEEGMGTPSAIFIADNLRKQLEQPK